MDNDSGEIFTRGERDRDTQETQNILSKAGTKTKNGFMLFLMTRLMLAQVVFKNINSVEKYKYDAGTCNEMNLKSSG